MTSVETKTDKISRNLTTFIQWMRSYPLTKIAASDKEKEEAQRALFLDPGMLALFAQNENLKSSVQSYADLGIYQTNESDSESSDDTSPDLLDKIIQERFNTNKREKEKQEMQKKELIGQTGSAKTVTQPSVTAVKVNPRFLAEINGNEELQIMLKKAYKQTMTPNFKRLLETVLMTDTEIAGLDYERDLVVFFASVYNMKPWGQMAIEKDVFDHIGKYGYGTEYDKRTGMTSLNAKALLDNMPDEDFEEPKTLNMGFVMKPGSKVYSDPGVDMFDSKGMFRSTQSTTEQKSEVSNTSYANPLLGGTNLLKSPFTMGLSPMKYWATSKVENTPEPVPMVIKKVEDKKFESKKVDVPSKVETPLKEEVKKEEEERGVDLEIPNIPKREIKGASQAMIEFIHSQDKLYWSYKVTPDVLTKAAKTKFYNMKNSWYKELGVNFSSLQLGEVQIMFNSKIISWWAIVTAGNQFSKKFEERVENYKTILGTPEYGTKDDFNMRMATLPNYSAEKFNKEITDSRNPKKEEKKSEDAEKRPTQRGRREFTEISPDMMKRLGIPQVAGMVVMSSEIKKNIKKIWKEESNKTLLYRGYNSVFTSIKEGKERISVSSDTSKLYQSKVRMEKQLAKLSDAKEKSRLNRKIKTTNRLLSSKMMDDYQLQELVKTIGLLPGPKSVSAIACYLMELKREKEDDSFWNPPKYTNAWWANLSTTQKTSNLKTLMDQIIEESSQEKKDFRKIALFPEFSTFISDNAYLTRGNSDNVRTLMRKANQEMYASLAESSSAMYNKWWEKKYFASMTPYNKIVVAFSIIRGSTGGSMITGRINIKAIFEDVINDNDELRKTIEKNFV